jgi:hypothetical protein
MTFPQRQRFNSTVSLGLVFMAAADVVRLVLERHSSVPEGPRDGLFGLLFGLGIGCIVLGMRQMRHAGEPPDRPRCV